MSQFIQTLSTIKNTNCIQTLENYKKETTDPNWLDLIDLRIGVLSRKAKVYAQAA